MAGYRGESECFDGSTVPALVTAMLPYGTDIIQSIASKSSVHRFENWLGQYFRCRSRNPRRLQRYARSLAPTLSKGPAPRTPVIHPESDLAMVVVVAAAALAAPPRRQKHALL